MPKRAIRRSVMTPESYSGNSLLKSDFVNTTEQFFYSVVPFQISPKFPFSFAPNAIMKLLIIEDEVSLLNSIAEYFEQENFLCEGITTDQEGMAKMEDFEYDTCSEANRRTEDRNSG
jgi:hypothetical protein